MKYEPVKDHAERKRISALIERCEKEETMSDDIRTATLLKLADHMKSINKTLTELNKEVEGMMQDIMRDLREETKGADDETAND